MPKHEKEQELTDEELREAAGGLQMARQENVEQEPRIAGGPLIANETKFRDARDKPKL